MPGFSDSEHRPNPDTKDNRTAERHYWNRQIIVQWAMVYITLFTFAAAATYAYWAWRQVEIMNKTLGVSERPWVGVIGVDVKNIALDSDSITLTGDVAVKNFGPRVALNSITLPLVTMDRSSDCKQIESTCSAALTFTTGVSHGGWSTSQVKIGTTLFPDQIFHATLNEGAGYGAAKFPIPVSVEGCSTYLGPLGQAEYLTKFCFVAWFDGKAFTSDWQLCHTCNDAQ
jgi:hypothetical protein